MVHIAQKSCDIRNDHVEYYTINNDEAFLPKYQLYEKYTKSNYKQILVKDTKDYNVLINKYSGKNKKTLYEVYYEDKRPAEVEVILSILNSEVKS